MYLAPTYAVGGFFLSICFTYIIFQLYSIFSRFLLIVLHNRRNAPHPLTVRHLLEIALDLPRHSSFRYITRYSLTEDYFQSAYAALEDDGIYIAISNSGSAATRLISLFTGKKYNHVSISFDRNLDTIISYNGGEKTSTPGLNRENIISLGREAGCPIIVYRLQADKEQKKKIIDQVWTINQEGSAYNILGLVFKSSFRPNIMFCSQFVYQMLCFSGLAYFDKNPASVRPSDFLELDQYRRLEYVGKIKQPASKWLA